MFHRRAALALALTTGSLLGLATFPGGAQAAPADVSLSHTFNCSNLTLDLTATNAGATPENVSFEVDTSKGASVTNSVTIAANGSATFSFNITPGTLVERARMFDADQHLIDSEDINLVLTTDDDCTRPPVHKVIVTNLAITCVDGALHLSLEVQNIGDVSETLVATAHGAWGDPATAAAAAAAGWNFEAEFTVAPGAKGHVEGAFRVDDQLDVDIIDITTGTEVLAASPRALFGVELACGGNVPVVEEQGPVDTTAPVDNGSGSGSGSGGTLPSTGGSSWALAFAALVLSSMGGLLVRTTRRAA